jgi:hypothetical protein
MILRKTKEEGDLFEWWRGGRGKERRERRQCDDGS